MNAVRAACFMPLCPRTDAKEQNLRGYAGQGTEPLQGSSGRCHWACLPIFRYEFQLITKCLWHAPKAERGDSGNWEQYRREFSEMLCVLNLANSCPFHLVYHSF